MEDLSPEPRIVALIHDSARLAIRMAAQRTTTTYLPEFQVFSLGSEVVADLGPNWTEIPVLMLHHFQHIFKQLVSGFGVTVAHVGVDRSLVTARIITHDSTVFNRQMEYKT